MSQLLLPDYLLLLLAFAVIGVDLLAGKKESFTAVFNFSWVGTAAVLGILIWLPKTETFTYLRHYRITPMCLYFKEIFIIGLLFTVFLSRSYFIPGGNHRGQLNSPGEFYGILLFCTFGMFTLVSSTDLLTFFVGLELATIPLYALTSFYKDDKTSSEAATKYILMGTTSTAIFLFGASLIYGATGSLEFDKIAAISGKSGLFVLGSVFLLASLGFKLALAPFHMWAPDVYQGAPTPITAFLSVSSKSAGVGALAILFYGPLANYREQLMPVIIIIACLTMLIGNLGALRQVQLRRFMAYSSIAHAGYILVALSGNQSLALPSILFFLLVYAVTNFCTFFIFSIIGEKRTETFSSLRGLSVQSPMLAGILSLCMFSLAGIPR